MSKIVISDPRVSGISYSKLSTKSSKYSTDTKSLIELSTALKVIAAITVLPGIIYLILLLAKRNSKPLASRVSTTQADPAPRSVSKARQERKPQAKTSNSSANLSQAKKPVQPSAAVQPVDINNNLQALTKHALELKTELEKEIIPTASSDRMIPATIRSDLRLIADLRDVDKRLVELGGNPILGGTLTKYESILSHKLQQYGE